NPDVPPQPGEVPHPYPTILQQVNGFSDAPETVDLVLITGGINDVDVRFILNPLTDPQELATLTHLYCHDHLLLLLQNTVPRCPNPVIIVTSYFPILSAQSDPDLLHVFLQTHFINIPTLPELEETFMQPPREVIFDKVVTLATTFWQTSTAAMQAAV